MAATTSPSPDAAGGQAGLLLLRFDRGERVLHWVNASLFAVVMATACALYVPPISAAVGRRELVKAIHVWSGLALPLPILMTIALRQWGAAFRADAGRLNRWSPADKRWLRTLGRDPYAIKGKFNAGQKLNAAFTGGAILLMLATGSIMRWPASFPLAWRTGATFVHDWIFFALFFTISGHVMFATKDPDSLRSMWRGHISARWARLHASAWHDEMTGRTSSSPSSPPGPGGSSPRAENEPV